MDKLSVGRVDNAKAFSAKAKTEVDIVVRNVQCLIEAADVFEHIPSHHHAGCGHSKAGSEASVETKVSEAPRRTTVERMPRNAAEAENYARVLNMCGREQKPRADSSNIGPLNVLKHRSHPARSKRLNVVVEEEQHVTFGLTHRPVIQAREIELMRITEEPHTVSGSDVSEVCAGLWLPAGVVDEKHLPAVLISRPPERVQAAVKKIGPVPEWKYDANKWITDDPPTHSIKAHYL